jgi:excisionase family DNA binding protein
MTPRRRASFIWQRVGTLMFVLGAFAGSARAADVAKTPASASAVMTIDEAAAFLRVPATELERMATRREAPGRLVAGEWRFNRDALLAWINGDWKLIRTLAAPGAQTKADTGQSQGAAAAEDAPAPIGEAPEKYTAEDIFLRSQKVLLAPGEVTADLGIFYSRSDNLVLVAVGGNVALGTFERRAFTTSLQARVGIFDETEAFVGANYFRETRDTFVGAQTISHSAGGRLGDVRLGVRRTLLKEGPGRPNLIATLFAAVPTGRGPYAIGGGFTLVKSLDPVVLYADASYLRRFNQDFDDVTRLVPRDQLIVNVGYALALNDSLSISTSVSGAFSGRTRFAIGNLRRQDAYSLSFGLTSWLTKGLYLEPTVGIGLNGPAHNFTFGLTVPYSF